MKLSVAIQDKDGVLVHEDAPPADLLPAIVDTWTSLKGFHRLTCPFCNERQAEAMSGYKGDHFYYQAKCKTCGTSVVFSNKCTFDHPMEIQHLQQQFEGIAAVKYRGLFITGLKEKLRIT